MPLKDLSVDATIPRKVSINLKINQKKFPILKFKKRNRKKKTRTHSNCGAIWQYGKV